MRLLTHEEIEDILSFIQPQQGIPVDTAQSVADSNKQRLRQQLEGKHVYPSIIPQLRAEIERAYRTSQVEPGECIGIVAAQSIGEKQTQTTLNSVTWDTQIMYNEHDTGKHVEPIGTFVDQLLTENKHSILEIAQNRTEYLSIENSPYTIPSCDSSGRIEWRVIEAVTRHLPVGKLVRITTRSGRTVTVTQSKSLLVWCGASETFEPVNGSCVAVGDCMPTTSYLPSVACSLGTSSWLTHDTGRSYGRHMATSSCDHEPLFVNGIRMDTYMQTLNAVHTAPRPFLTGIVQGYVECCEYISDDNNMCCITTRTRRIRDMLVCIYSYLGIFVEMHGDYGIRLGFNAFHAEDYRRVNDVCLDPIARIDYVTDETCDYVYDLTVATTRNFQLYNGLNVRDTFHKAGQSEKTMTVGVPRFQQLLNATKRPTHVNHRLHFTHGNSTIQHLRSMIGHSIVGLTLMDITEKMSVILYTVPQPWYAPYLILYPEKTAIINPDHHCLRIKLKKSKLFEFKIDLETIRRAIESEYSDLQCICSSLQDATIDVYPSLDDIELPENRSAYYNHPDMITIYLEESVQTELEKLYICGIPSITEIFYTRDSTEKGNETWCIETNAFDSHHIATQYNSFKRILTLPSLDFTRTVSSNVWDIYEVLGVEAAREFLIQEFMQIMEGINDCHARLLVDRMTHTGTISSITRYTLKREQSGAFGKASFEESMDHFLNAAAQGDTDTTQGVSASIICGKRARIGTGMFDTHVDIDNLPESILM